MTKYTVLDCTLRDGGYVNNWEFGKKAIQNIVKKLCDASIELIECGLVSNQKKSNSENSIFNSILEAEEFFSVTTKKELTVMINYGEYDINAVEKYSGGIIKTIRVAFHKNQLKDAISFCFELQKKGYDIFLQPMYTIGYSAQELLSLVEWANEFKPIALYLVDSFGTMRKKDLLKMFRLIDSTLNENIKIGFHSHNNMQLSFSNAQELLFIDTSHDIIIDTSVFGIGRGAGNLCTELMTQYINENFEKKYDIIPILEIMDEYIMPIYSQSPWGYSAPYYIAAINSCHPNYATFLTDKQNLNIKDINSIIKCIPFESKFIFDNRLILDLYLKYQSHNIDDSHAVENISNMCRNRTVLIIAPGKSILKFKDNIANYIAENSPVVFAVNHIPDMFAYDKVFVSNHKRFRSIDEAVQKVGSKLICTSNLSTSDEYCVINYSSYLNGDEIISDNAGLLLINFLCKAGVKSLSLAGFDGFSISDTSNYYDEGMINNLSIEHKAKVNNAIISYFSILKKKVDVNFITPTIYQK